MSCTILKTKTQSPGWHRAVWRHTSCSPSDARNLSESLCKCSTFVFQQSHGERKTVPLRCHQNNPQEDCLVTGSTTTRWHWHIKKREIKIDLTAECGNPKQQGLTSDSPDKKLRRNEFWCTLPACPTMEPVQCTAQSDASRHITSTLCHPGAQMGFRIWYASHHRDFFKVFPV